MEEGKSPPFHELIICVMFMCLCVAGNLYADKRFLEFPSEIWGRAVFP